ncbi:MAG: hypothetical protein RLZZ469_405, partial [Bacteroidota bacterium]
MNPKNTFTSDVSGIEFPIKEKVTGKSIRLPILDLIKSEHPDFSSEHCLANAELNVYREKYISRYLNTEISQLSKLQKKVIEALNDDKSFVSKMEEDLDNRTLGQVVADKVAAFGGSWTFIIAFFIFIALWIGSNVFILLNKGFDPYPFI